MKFSEAMDLVEYTYPFPTPTHFNGLRTEWLLRRSGLIPSLQKVPRITVAGSMGKASTARFLAFILQQAQTSQVVLATKPPLQESPEGNLERYQHLLPGETGSRWLDQATFARYVGELRPLLAELPEELGPLAPYDLRSWVLARMALEPEVGWLIQEANIGLRLDPARAYPPPALTLLTPIREEHYDLLTMPPDVRAELAHLGRSAGPVWHKAGGVWPGTPVVLGPQSAPVETACLKLLTGPVIRFGQDYALSQATSDFSGGRGRLRLGELDFAFTTPLLGAFQLENAAQAAAAAVELQKLGLLKLDQDQLQTAIVAGLARADSPGRMERVNERPTTVFTAGGSSSKTAAAVESLEELLAPGVGWVACVTVMESLSDARELLSTLLNSPRLAGFVATAYTGDPGQLDLPAEQLADWARELRPDLPVQFDSSIPAAIDKARALAGPEDVVLLIGAGLGQGKDGQLGANSPA